METVTDEIGTVSDEFKGVTEKSNLRQNAYYCRLCLQVFHRDSLVELYQDDKLNSEGEKIQDFLHSKLHSTENIPRQACRSCITILNLSLQLLKKLRKIEECFSQGLEIETVLREVGGVNYFNVDPANPRTELTNQKPMTELTNQKPMTELTNHMPAIESASHIRGIRPPNRDAPFDLTNESTSSYILTNQEAAQGNNINSLLNQKKSEFETIKDITANITREEYPWRTSGHPLSQRPRKIETKRHKETKVRQILPKMEFMPMEVPKAAPLMSSGGGNQVMIPVTLKTTCKSCRKTIVASSLSEFKSHSCQVLRDQAIECKISDCGKKFFGKNSLKFHQKFAHYQRKRGRGKEDIDGKSSQGTNAVALSLIQDNHRVTELSSPASTVHDVHNTVQSLNSTLQSVQGLQYRTEFSEDGEERIVLETMVNVQEEQQPQQHILLFGQQSQQHAGLLDQQQTLESCRSNLGAALNNSNTQQFASTGDILQPKAGGVSHSLAQLQNQDFQGLKFELDSDDQMSVHHTPLTPVQYTPHTSFATQSTTSLPHTSIQYTPHTSLATHSTISIPNTSVQYTPHTSFATHSTTSIPHTTVSNTSFATLHTSTDMPLSSVTSPRTSRSLDIQPIYSISPSSSASAQFSQAVREDNRTINTFNIQDKSSGFRIQTLAVGGTKPLDSPLDIVQRSMAHIHQDVQHVLEQHQNFDRLMFSEEPEKSSKQLQLSQEQILGEQRLAKLSQKHIIALASDKQLPKLSLGQIVGDPQLSPEQLIGGQQLSKLSQEQLLKLDPELKLGVNSLQQVHFVGKKIPTKDKKAVRPLYKYNCDHAGCTRSYSQKSYLIQHKRLHSGERPFICPRCGRGFSRVTDQKKHMLLKVCCGT